VRDAFRYLSGLLFVAVVVQIALAGYGAFDTVHVAKDAGSVAKKTVDDGWNAHAILGSGIILVLLLLVLIAAIGRLGSRWLQESGGLFVLAILQMAFAALGRSVPALGFLHAITALAIFAGAGMLVRRSWTTRRTAPAA
jgi:hypothetical protein